MEVPETFPTDFGIYDLNEFLGVLTLAKDADIQFDNTSYLTADSGTTKIKYFYSDPSILTTPPETFNAPDCDVTFDVSSSVLSSVLKASAVMQLPDVVMKSQGSGVEVTATDLKNTSSNNYTETLDSVGSTFEFRLKADNLKMIPGDYTVQASTTAGVSNWKGTEASYWIAMEANTD